MNLNNFKNFIKVVIMDDKKLDGDEMQRGLHKIHIPSIFYHVTSNKSLPKKPCRNVRLVILDLIFKDSGSMNASQSAGNALSKLSKIVDSNAFYILIIWSDNTMRDVFTQFQIQLARQDRFSKPYKIIPLQKTDYKTTNGYDMNAVLKKVNAELETIPAFQTFSIWEELASDSISTVSSKVSQDKSQQELSKVINSLAFAYAGKDGKEKTPRNALFALNDIFKDALSKKIAGYNFSTLHSKISTGKLNDKEKARFNTDLIFTPDRSEGPGTIYQIEMTDDAKTAFIVEMLNTDRTKLDTNYDKIVPISINITQLCNHAQRNGHHNYFLDGLILPYPLKHKIQTGTSTRMAEVEINRHFSYDIGKSFLSEDDSEYFFLFNLKHFHSTKSGKPNKFRKSTMRLRENIVIDLQHALSSYISRPGHILL